LWGRTVQGAVPYGLILPVLVVIGVILGYPLYWLVKLSTQRYGLFELIRHQGVSVGLHNYGSVLHDGVFWRTLLRTVVFTAVNVTLTMGLGMLLALLLVRVSTFVRVLLSSGLVLVWSMPVVVAVQVWYWMTNYENGVVNYVLSNLGIGDFFQHDWYATTFSQLSIVTLLIVWGALPFVVITLYAGLAQVPPDLVEAAEVDGARGWRIFLDITLPILRPILLILTSLSIIWDFGVFDQIYIMGDNVPDKAFWNIGVYAYSQAFRQGYFGLGAAISIVMVFLLLLVSILYIRQMIKLGETE
jgi:N,N'-diacetylchitobiose transport system permease protein